ncbi:GNAT family N-acetyltransferase [Candidatus Woesearchaeota archaeon]|nr:GNAT family N-acetyltransferase [Candidatus Woesearchaeota archaeon]
MIFETERLILRKPRKTDWKDVVEGVKGLEVSKNLATVPHPYKKKDALWWINRTIKKWRKKQREGYTFVIELKSEKKVIGATSVENINYQNKTAITGSWINKKYWKKGYITEAKVPILDFAFDKLKLRRLESQVFTNNKASNSMAIKFGFKREGTRKKVTICKADGKIYDDNIYALFRSDWRKARAKILRGKK